MKRTTTSFRPAYEAPECDTRFVETAMPLCISNLNGSSESIDDDEDYPLF